MVSLPIANDSIAEGPPPAQDGERPERVRSGSPSTGVRYGQMNWLGQFTYRSDLTVGCGAKVVVQTERGIELGQEVSLSCSRCGRDISREQIDRYVSESGPEFFRPTAGRILRVASPQDVAEHERLNAHINDDLSFCGDQARALGLDLKVVTAEHLLGGERIVFYFRSEQRIDFRQLVKELAARYQTRIEMRQVGARDEARLVADYEVCGRECCCKNFLKKLRPVSMKMAKIQKSTLDPSKVSGRCGRLRCCLRYEHEGYVELKARLPRHGTWVQTEFGPGEVIDSQILTQLVLVRTPEQREVAVPMEEIVAFNIEPPPLPPADAEGANAGRRPPRARPSAGADRPRSSEAGSTTEGTESVEVDERSARDGRSPRRRRGPRPDADMRLSGSDSEPRGAERAEPPAATELAAPPVEQDGDPSAAAPMEGSPDSSEATPGERGADSPDRPPDRGPGRRRRRRPRRGRGEDRRPPAAPPA